MPRCFPRCAGVIRLRVQRARALARTPMLTVLSTRLAGICELQSSRGSVNAYCSVRRVARSGPPASKSIRAHSPAAATPKQTGQAVTVALSMAADELRPAYPVLQTVSWATVSWATIVSAERETSGAGLGGPQTLACRTSAKPGQMLPLLTCRARRLGRASFRRPWPGCRHNPY